MDNKILASMCEADRMELGFVISGIKKLNWIYARQAHKLSHPKDVIIKENTKVILDSIVNGIKGGFIDDEIAIDFIKDMKLEVKMENSEGKYKVLITPEENFKIVKGDETLKEAILYAISRYERNSKNWIIT